MLLDFDVRFTSLLSLRHRSMFVAFLLFLSIAVVVQTPNDDDEDRGFRSVPLTVYFTVINFSLLDYTVFINNTINTN